MTDPRRRIPSVEALLSASAFVPLVETRSRGRVTEVLRSVLEQTRDQLDAVGGVAGQEGLDQLEDAAWYADRVAERLARAERPSLRSVINASGVVLHTNLGRAPLADSARRAMLDAAGYASLEYDLEEGRRGARGHCEGLLRELTGAEAALVVNNNAAAVVLALNSLAEGKSTVISRGELVEIGGSFRVPEIMAKSGARMVEVGATNRTHWRDYADALAQGAGLILKVHRSNFRLEGFTAEVPARELADLARGAGIPFVHDLGSGALVDLTELGLPPELSAGQALAEGADVVTMSGDKLLGGPQAGILLGRRDLLDLMRSNPLHRAFRSDKLTLAALEATLALYRDGRARAEIPVLRMLAAEPERLLERAESLARRLRSAGVEAESVEATAAVGGGAYPGVELPGAVVAVSGSEGAEALARRLRLGSPPVVGRVRDGRVLLAPRTVGAEQEDALIGAVAAAVQAGVAGVAGVGRSGAGEGR